MLLARTVTAASGCRPRFCSLVDERKLQSKLTINLQRATLNDLEATLRMDRRAILEPLDVGRRCAGCTTRKHRHASFWQRLICWPNLNDWGRDVVYRYDLERRKGKLFGKY